jgi:hypothetical protein
MEQAEEEVMTTTQVDLFWGLAAVAAANLIVGWYVGTSHWQRMRWYVLGLWVLAIYCGIEATWWREMEAAVAQWMR